ncbi:RNA-binding signal recognition particle 68 domain-containing protein [Hirsutella rhossiliensis]|uniref:Signal recognition particle subunit SRP68 n=1 Tax=Hirsutella rhossiliensis TaxID=111463 RepID=A0A9P8SM01_9HYPO|nr:RNA-binding signal recognition particle 68 domain-containing protein [Hirsutella rhossiliensis]KAH0965676.1 RNA-binding signal recognition particle 68 domain-containing protein [Hirsutella rhossiliensis]
MEITSFVVQGRDQALLYGDYSTYHSQLAKRLLNSRKKLGVATKNRGKFQKRDNITALQVGGNHEYVHLLLLTSERAWAQAMSAKSAHSSGQNDMTRRTRSHIVSRLDKAARTAQDLVQLLSQKDASASTADLLEAKAYTAFLRGAMQFERRSWEPCLQSYAIARIVYSALATSGKGDHFKDLLSETIDPSIRYAAYQLKTPRTVPIPTIAKRAFPRSDDALTQQVNQIDPTLLADADATSKSDGSAAQGVPGTLTWRSREVQIEDAQISLAWASVDGAKSSLAKTLAGAKNREPYEVAAAYDELLTATQDAVDATKQAIDELKNEGVSQSDARMQRLQITRTAVNYEMISWRIGRNRVLTGRQDGAPEEYGSLRRKKAKAAPSATKKERELPTSRKLARLKEKVALYDGILRSLESIKELPGIAADEPLATKVDAFGKYFESLKCLTIARSHAVVGNVANALALINHAAKLCGDSASKLPKSAPAANALPLGIEVSSEALDSLTQLLNGELQRHRAIVHIDNLRKADGDGAAAGQRVPLIERLHEYPTHGVDLENLVEFPPKMELIPMKPIFLDVAWNYIDYPGKLSGTDAPAVAVEAAPEGAPQQKRGWFSFGR